MTNSMTGIAEPLERPLGLSFITIDRILEQFNSISSEHDFRLDTSRIVDLLPKRKEPTFADIFSGYHIVFSRKAPVVQTVLEYDDVQFAFPHMVEGVSSKKVVGYAQADVYELIHDPDFVEEKFTLRMYATTQLKDKKTLRPFKMERTISGSCVFVSLPIPVQKHDLTYLPFIGRVPLIGHREADLTPYFPDTCVTPYAAPIVKDDASPGNEQTAPSALTQQK